LLKDLKWLRTNDSFAVDHESRCALYAQLAGVVGIGSNDGCVFFGIQTFVESVGIQAELGGKLFEVVFVERAAVLPGLAFE